MDDDSKYITVDPAPPPKKRKSTYDAHQPTDTDWSLGRMSELQSWYAQTFPGKKLPVRNLGQGSIHNKLGYDHRESSDISLNPATPEGQALIQQLRARNVPFLAFDRAVPGVSTGAHIHVGRPSHKAGKQYGVGSRINRTAQQRPTDDDAKYITDEDIPTEDRKYIGVEKAAAPTPSPTPRKSLAELATAGAGPAGTLPKSNIPDINEILTAARTPQRIPRGPGPRSPFEGLTAGAAPVQPPGTADFRRAEEREMAQRRRVTQQVRGAQRGAEATLDQAPGGRLFDTMRTADEEINARLTAESAQAAADAEQQKWEAANAADIATETARYRDDITAAKTIGGDPNKWMAETGTQAGAGFAELVSGILTGGAQANQLLARFLSANDSAFSDRPLDTPELARKLRVHAVAAQRAAEAEGWDRNATSKIVQSTVAGLISSAPEFAAMSAGLSAPAVFGAGAGLRAKGSGRPVAPAAAHGAATGVAFETSIPGKGVAAALERGASTGLYSSAIELSTGAEISDALSVGVQNALMRGGPEAIREIGSLNVLRERALKMSDAELDAWGKQLGVVDDVVAPPDVKPADIPVKEAAVETKPVESPPTPAPPVEAPAQVKFVITKAEEAALKQRGYTDAQIYKMKPAEAAEILAQPEVAAETPAPGRPTAAELNEFYKPSPVVEESPTPTKVVANSAPYPSPESTSNPTMALELNALHVDPVRGHGMYSASDGAVNAYLKKLERAAEKYKSRDDVTGLVQAAQDAALRGDFNQMYLNSERALSRLHALLPSERVGLAKSREEAEIPADTKYITEDAFPERRATPRTPEGDLDWATNLAERRGGSIDRDGSGFIVRMGDEAVSVRNITEAVATARELDTKLKIAEGLDKPVAEARTPEVGQPLEHPSPAHTGKEIIAVRADEKVVVATPENKSGISVLTPRQVREREAVQKYLSRPGGGERITTPEQQDAYDRTMRDLHTHPGRNAKGGGFRDVREADVNRYFDRLWKAADRYTPEITSLVTEAETAYHKGDLGKAAKLSEQVLTTIHNVQPPIPTTNKSAWEGQEGFVNIKEIAKAVEEKALKTGEAILKLRVLFPNKSDRELHGMLAAERLGYVSENWARKIEERKAREEAYRVDKEAKRVARLEATTIPEDIMAKASKDVDARQKYGTRTETPTKNSYRLVWSNNAGRWNVAYVGHPKGVEVKLDANEILVAAPRGVAEAIAHKLEPLPLGQLAFEKNPLFKPGSKLDDVGTFYDKMGRARGEGMDVQDLGDVEVPRPTKRLQVGEEFSGSMNMNWEGLRDTLHGKPTPVNEYDRTIAAIKADFPQWSDAQAKAWVKRNRPDLREGGGMGDVIDLGDIDTRKGERGFLNIDEIRDVLTKERREQSDTELLKNLRLQFPNKSVEELRALIQPESGEIQVYRTTSRGPGSSWNTRDIGPHFGTKEAANTMAVGQEGREGLATMPTKLELRNPVTLPDVVLWNSAEKIIDALKKFKYITPEEAGRLHRTGVAANSDAKMKGDHSTRPALKVVRDFLESRGFDGIRYINNFEDAGSISYIPFKPEQARSVFGGQGGFIDIGELAEGARAALEALRAKHPEKGNRELFYLARRENPELFPKERSLPKTAAKTGREPGTNLTYIERAQAPIVQEMRTRLRTEGPEALEAWWADNAGTDRANAAGIILADHYATKSAEAKDQATAEALHEKSVEISNINNERATTGGQGSAMWNQMNKFTPGGVANEVAKAQERGVKVTTEEFQKAVKTATEHKKADAEVEKARAKVEELEAAAKETASAGDGKGSGGGKGAGDFETVSKTTTRRRTPRQRTEPPATLASKLKELAPSEQVREAATRMIGDTDLARWMRETKTKYGMTTEQATKLGQQAHKLLKDARKAATEAGRMATLRKKYPEATTDELAVAHDNLVAALKRRRDAKIEMARFFDRLSQKQQGYYRRSLNITRAMMVSQIATAMRNLQSQAVRFNTERLTDIVQHTLRKVVGLESDFTYRNIGRNTLRQFKPSERLAREIAGEHPELLGRMFNEYFAGIEIPQLERGPLANKFHRGVERVFGTMERASKTVNFANQMQEFHLRAAEFLSELDLHIRKDRNMSLEKFVARYGVDAIPKPMVEAATQKALEVTFADNPGRNGLGGQALNIAIEVGNYIPPTVSPIAFPKFMFNALKFLYQYNPTGLIDLARKSSREQLAGKPISEKARLLVTNRALSRALVGSTMLLTAYGFRNSEYAGEKWYEIKLGDHTVDARPFGPFSTYLFLAENIRRWWYEEKPFTIKEIAEALGASSGPGGTAMAVAEKMYDYAAEGQWDKFQRILKTEAGEWGAALLTPIRQVKDLVAAFDPEEGFTRDISDAPFTGKLRESIPGMSRDLPPAGRPTRESSIRQEHPLIKVATGWRVQTPKTFLESQLDELHFTPAEVRSSTGIAKIDSFEKRTMGPLMDQLSKELEGSPEFKALGPAQRASEIKKRIIEIREEVRDMGRAEMPEEYERLKEDRKPKRKKALEQELNSPGISKALQLGIPMSTPPMRADEDDLSYRARLLQLGRARRTALDRVVSTNQFTALNQSAQRKALRTALV